MAKFNAFVSYCHKDEQTVTEIIDFLAPLKESGLVGNWFDRKLIAGDDHFKNIDEAIYNSDFIFLFISSNFLISQACKDEKEKSFLLEKEKNKIVIPIILSACGWLDDKELSSRLALPIDGKPVIKFSEKTDAYMEIYDGIKSLAEREVKMQDIKLYEEFEKMLKSADLLTKAHSKKDNIFLDDIFVYPEVKYIDESSDSEEYIGSEEIIKLLVAGERIVLSGDVQSGRTSFCKMAFKNLRADGYFPIYVEDKELHFHGKIENKVREAFSKQYQNIEYSELKSLKGDKIILIIDNFHHSRHKERNIQELAEFKAQLLIVDDVFGLNIKAESNLRSYNHFRINELNPTKRNELIEKWINLGDFENNDFNDRYRILDKTTELIDSTLGYRTGRGIMPCYPFLVLTILSNSQSSKPIDKEISSQGYCYQALIYLYLSKAGVSNDDMDTYYNFLTYLSYKFYSEKIAELSSDEFIVFMGEYLDKFYLPVDEEILISKLVDIQILYKDSLGNLRFCYEYIYYFFVAKYLSENISDCESIIREIIENLHTDENIYIAIFISHHSKNNFVLDELAYAAISLFDGRNPASLDKSEMQYLDEKVSVIVEELLPSNSGTSESERAKRLKQRDKVEEEKRRRTEQDEMLDEFQIELRRSLKTVEVIGVVIKNRTGSMDKEKLHLIFKEAMEVHLRILSYFFDLIREGEPEIIDYITNDISKEGDFSELSDTQIRNMARNAFFRMNFLFIHSLVNKIVHSLGSDKTEIVNDVCDEINTPSSFLVKHGVNMWYKKNLQVDNILAETAKNTMSETSKRVLRFMILDHCAMHSIHYTDKQRIEKKLGIPVSKMLSK